MPLLFISSHETCFNYSEVINCSLWIVQTVSQEHGDIHRHISLMLHSVCSPELCILSAPWACCSSAACQMEFKYNGIAFLVLRIVTFGHSGRSLGGG